MGGLDPFLSLGQFSYVLGLVGGCQSDLVWGGAVCVLDGDLKGKGMPGQGKAR